METFEIPFVRDCIIVCPRATLLPAAEDGLYDWSIACPTRTLLDALVEVVIIPRPNTVLPVPVLKFVVLLPTLMFWIPTFGVIFANPPKMKVFRTL